MKKKLETIQNKAVENRKNFYDLIDQARNILEGKTITINDEKFNGQPYGISKKSLKGKSFIYTKAENIFTYISDEGKIYIQPFDCNATISLDDCLIEE